MLYCFALRSLRAFAGGNANVDNVNNGIANGEDNVNNDNNGVRPVISSCFY